MKLSRSHKRNLKKKNGNVLILAHLHTVELMASLMTIFDFDKIIRALTTTTPSLQKTNPFF